MVLVVPFVPNIVDVNIRNRIQSVFKEREHGNEFRTDLFTLTVIENWADMVSQFMQIGSTDKYRIILRNSVVVAQASTSEGILADWNMLINNIVLPQDSITTDDILTMIEKLRKNQDAIRIPTMGVTNRKNERKNGLNHSHSDLATSSKNDYGEDLFDTRSVDESRQENLSADSLAEMFSKGDNSLNKHKSNDSIKEVNREGSASLVGSATPIKLTAKNNLVKSEGASRLNGWDGHGNEEHDRLTALENALQSRPPFVFFQESTSQITSVIEDKNKEDNEAVFQDEIYENQRSGLVGGFSDALLFSIDTCGPWSDEDGNPKIKDDFLLPTIEWDWISNWEFEKTSLTDPEGWKYAMTWSSQWYNEVKPFTFVRRRKWIRRRKIVKTVFPPAIIKRASEESKEIDKSLIQAVEKKRTMVRMRRLVRSSLSSLRTWSYRDVIILSLVFSILFMTALNILEMSRLQDKIAHLIRIKDS